MKRLLMSAAILSIAVSLSARSKHAETYDLHGTVTGIGDRFVNVGWFPTIVHDYTIRSGDRSYVVLWVHLISKKTPPLQLGEKVDFRMEQRLIFMPGAQGKEMKFEITEERLEPAQAGSEVNAASSAGGTSR